ncbi:MAG TPA: NUDIX domain-containing protein [Trebonia sp.]|jgi:ADP-ribose pyrophosphatase YjhB (NUDIX family)|nr:NUDIX domain-containing protein [Trebonia sp.]
MTTHVIGCVGAVIKDGAGRLLLVKRGHEPGKGLWSIPGGRIEPGESDEAALVREVREETGLVVTAGRLVGAVRRPAGGSGGSGGSGDSGGSGAVLDIRDYAAEVTGGTLVPGDDADAAVWADAADLDRLPLTDGLLDALRSWGAL